MSKIIAEKYYFASGKCLYSITPGMPLLQKPEKIYLHHPNLIYALSSGLSDIGNLRESFFVNQTSVVMPVSYAEEGDFKVGQYIFEVGGRKKSSQQIQHLKKAYIAADNIEIGHQQKIPLYLFLKRTELNPNSVNSSTAIVIFSIIISVIIFLLGIFPDFLLQYL